MVGFFNRRLTRINADVMEDITGQSDGGSGGLVCRFSFGCRCRRGFASC